MVVPLCNRRKRIDFLKTLALLLSYKVATMAISSEMGTDNNHHSTNPTDHDESCLHIYDEDDEESSHCYPDTDDREERSIQQHSHQIIRQNSFLNLDTNHEESVILVATVDGMLSGLSRSTGEILWKHAPNPQHSYRMHRTSSLLDPWVSTTSSKTSSSTNTFAVPSIIDGKVYITTTDETSAEEITADMAQLQARAPFCDDRGRFFTATRATTVTAVNVLTGEITMDDNDPRPNRDFIWVGRDDIHMTIQPPNAPNVQVSYAQILSVQDMVLGQTVTPELTGSSLETDDDKTTLLWATPSGHVAYVPTGNQDGGWMTHLGSSPVAAAIDASNGGSRLTVRMVPDARRAGDPIVPTNTMRISTTMIVGSLHGQPFAMPLQVAAQLTVPSASCEPGSSTFPRCLTKAVLSSSKDPTSGGGIVPFHDFNAYDVYHRRPPMATTYDHRPPRRPPLIRRKINTGYLYPAMLAILVAFFEVGRRIRDRQKALPPQHVIQVHEHIVLGHGGGGTMVYEGVVDGRPVAVKRLLRTYHASADREISLLIESDGHPHVVRYFLKEVRGDFVYLALELCDVSLHTLIGTLAAHRNHRQVQGKNDDDDDTAMLESAIRTLLWQIVQGVAHLHLLRIVHRDLKPGNILLAKTTKKKSLGSESHYDVFLRGDYVAKISDMGLGKQLVGHSSYGGESSLRASRSNNGQSSSVAGVGAGSVGWQAPEVMAQRHHVPSDASVKSEGSSNDPVSDMSPIDMSSHARTSRSVDIFSLGCIFYSTLVPGCHPFGEWYEREANIMHNRPNLDALMTTMPDAYDLVKSMLSRTPSSRPTSKQVGEHPFFWSPERRLAFLCDFSDRLESDFTICAETGDTKGSTRLFAIERDAAQVIGSSWDKLLDDALVNNVQKWRTYDASAVRDLLRLMRNKYHHFDELPEDFKNSIGTKSDGLMRYFEKRFPSKLYGPDDTICKKYSIRPVCDKVRQRCKDSQPQSGDESIITPIEPPSLENSVAIDHGVGLLTTSNRSFELPAVIEDPSAEKGDQPEEESREAGVVNDRFVVWNGSTASRTLNCRGWNRPDDDWLRQGPDNMSKKGKDLLKCSEDPRYRTRLCNHWDASLGTFCPMQKKGKCIFAHGPIELRVKELKRYRWGLFVDADGNCQNPKASGGEDTYGSARSIETERKQEGKWNTDKKTKKTPMRKRQTNRRTSPALHQGQPKSISLASGLA